MPGNATLIRRATYRLLFACLSFVSVHAGAVDDPQPTRPQLTDSPARQQVSDQIYRLHEGTLVMSLYGVTLVPDALVSACAKLHPRYAKSNIAALKLWEQRNANALKWVRSKAHALLVALSNGDEAVAEARLAQLSEETNNGIRVKLAAGASNTRKTCKQVPNVLAGPEFNLETHEDWTLMHDRK